MIHHFSEIQKQQLLHWQSMVCGVMVCKVIPFLGKLRLKITIMTFGEMLSGWLLLQFSSSFYPIVRYICRKSIKDCFFVFF